MFVNRLNLAGRRIKKTVEGFGDYKRLAHFKSSSASDISHVLLGFKTHNVCSCVPALFIFPEHVLLKYPSRIRNLFYCVTAVLTCKPSDLRRQTHL